MGNFEQFEEAFEENITLPFWQTPKKNQNEKSKVSIYLILIPILDKHTFQSFF